MKVRLRLITTLAAGAVCVAGAAPRPAQFSSRTVGVRVDALVLQGKTPVAGLTAADFELRDNGVLQAIDSVESDDAPINAVLALDASASTEGQRLADLTDAGRSLIDGLRPRDRVALTTFNHVVTPRVALTSDFAAVRAALDGIVPSGKTSVLDGLYVALVATLDEPGRALIVVCTDGQDTSSWLQLDEVMETAKRSNAVIYAVTVGRGDHRGPALKDATDLTGGRLVEIRNSRDYASELQQILQQFRAGYLVTFTPKDVDAAGFHRLDLKVKRRGAVVKARQGYVGAR